jgi:ribonuclease T1
MASSGSRSSDRLRQALRKWGAAVVVASGLAAGGLSAAGARTPDNPATAAPVALASLPAEAQATHRLILSSGPFPYRYKDGGVFSNRERQLPARARGYYREYTVKTPGARDRGARRIVCGGKPPTQPETCFYTDDHYASFRRIAP